MADELFTAARFESIRINEYQMKVLKNETKRAFIDEYQKSNGEFTEELKKKTMQYKLVMRGIRYTNYPDLKEEVTYENMINTFLEIKGNSEKDFIKFYDSYTRKLQTEFNDEEKGKEITANAYRDLKTAYHTYRKCNTSGWSCPDELVKEVEITNLYNALIKKAKEREEQGER